MAPDKTWPSLWHQLRYEYSCLNSDWNSVSYNNISSRLSKTQELTEQSPPVKLPALSLFLSHSGCSGVRLLEPQIAVRDCA